MDLINESVDSLLRIFILWLKSLELTSAHNINFIIYIIFWWIMWKALWKYFNIIISTKIPIIIQIIL